jgi:hypothetical protein
MDVLHPSWATPPVTVTDPAAIRHYESAVAALVAEAPHATSLLDEALAEHPDVALTRVARAVADAMRDGAFLLPDIGDGLSRGERQHLEVVRATFAGDAERASDLRREHLSEFAGDLLIVWLPVALGTGQ